MRIRQTAETGLYAVEYEKSAIAPHEEMLEEATIVRSSLSLSPSVAQRLDASDERVSRLTNLVLRIREAEANPDISRLDFSDLLRHRDDKKLPSIHLHSTEDLALISEALQRFVHTTPQHLAYMELRNARPEDYSTRRGAAEAAGNMHTQIHDLLGATALSPISTEASHQTPEISLNTGYYL